MSFMSVEFRLRAGLRRDTETGTYIAYCPALKLYSAGRTEDGAAQAITSAVRLYLEACWERGQFESAMRICNFQPDARPGATNAPSLPGSPDVTPEDDEYVAIQEDFFDKIIDLNVPFIQGGIAQTCPH